MVKNKNKTVLLGLLISILTLSLIASTYAFVRLSTTNANNFRTSLKAGTMSLVFSDGNPGFNTQISLGGSVEKIFTIENTGQAETYATMSWKELQNTYTPGSLVYTLEESSDGGLTYTNRVSETPVPTSNTGLTIAENLTIPVGTTMYYKLTISYIFLEGVNQTQDLHAYLNTLFTLEEGSFIDKAILRTKGASNYWSSDNYYDKIRTITFITQNINIPGDAVASWDMSTAGDGRIMAYLVNNISSTEDTPLYDLYIATDRMQVYGNSDSSYLFSKLILLETINNIEVLNTSSTTKMNSMFSLCQKITHINLDNFDTSNVTDMSYMFSYCDSLISLDLSSFDTSKVTIMNEMFHLDINPTTHSGITGFKNSLEHLDISSFDTSNVTNMREMFSGCFGLSDINTSNFNTANVTNMQLLFNNCSGLQTINISNFNTTRVTNMGQMFAHCNSLENLDLSGFNTSNVTNMYGMFSGCSKLTNVDLSSFNTSKVTSMGYMFYFCNSLASLDLSNFDTSNVTDMGYMFAFDINTISKSIISEIVGLNGFNTQNVTNMTGMFWGAIMLTELDLSSFDTSKVINMSKMFYNCYSIVKIFVSNSWLTNSVTESTHMFTLSTSLVGGAGTTYNSSYIDATYAHIDGGPSNPGYLTLKV